MRWTRTAAAMLPGAAAAAALLAMMACTPPTGPVPDDNVVVAPSGVVAETIQLTNDARREAGLSGLAAHNRLMHAAELQVAQVAAAGRLAHDLPEARYPTLQDRMAAAGYSWQAIGENLAFGQRNAAEVVSGWLSSPGHRANILNPTFTEIGAAYVVDANGRPWYVQVFGRPR